MKVICLKGVGNSGKSKTLKRILNQIFEIRIMPSDKKDAALMFRWNNKNVLFCSYGDSEKETKKFVTKPLEREEFHIVVCACHPRNSSYRLLDDKIGAENIDFIECPVGESEEEYNKRIKKFKEFLGED